MNDFDYNQMRDVVVQRVIERGWPNDWFAILAAMKLNAISGNGTRLKDFVDIAYLSSSLSLQQMPEAYSEK